MTLATSQPGMDREIVATQRGGGDGEIMSGFQDSAANVSDLAVHAGTASTIAREEAEVKAAIVLARQCPRNELGAYTRIMRSCERPTFAEKARYSFPRGKQQIEGASVQMAREMARCWGNIRTGIRIVSIDDQLVHVKGYAYDMETNAYVENEAKFNRLVQRKDRQTGETRWVQPDERDLRELVNKHGAMCVRNSILQILPPDIKEDALTKVKATIQAAASGELKQDRGAAIKRLVLAFSELQITTAMLTDYLGHEIELVTDEEVADLRGVYTSIRDGQAKREEYFSVNGGKPAEGNGSRTAALEAKIADKRKAETTEPTGFTWPANPDEKIKPGSRMSYLASLVRQANPELSDSDALNRLTDFATAQKISVTDLKNGETFMALFEACRANDWTAEPA